MVEETVPDKSLNQNNRNRRYSQFKISAIPCLRCGACCRSYQPWLTLAEIDQLADRFGISVSKFISDYTDRRWPGTQSYLLLHREGACLFLEASPGTRQSLCRIQAFKPACCRAWNSSLYKPECQAGLKDRFGLAVDPQGRIFGDAANLSAFEEYVMSLKS
jgi:Fe-S-cluster containining protein